MGPAGFSSSLQPVARRPHSLASDSPPLGPGVPFAGRLQVPFLGKSRGVQEVVASLYFHTAIGRFCRAETRIAAWSRVGKFCHRLLLRDVTGGAGDSWPRVTPIFCLECIANRRPSNWLHRRFHRVKLSRPLKTLIGAPRGRTGTSEGGRTAPNARQSSNCGRLLCIRV